MSANTLRGFPFITSIILNSSSTSIRRGPARNSRRRIEACRPPKGSVKLDKSDASVTNCGVNTFDGVVISFQYFRKKRYLDGHPGNSVLCKHQRSEDRKPHH
jgi:hypothetical protein